MKRLRVTAFVLLSLGCGAVFAADIRVLSPGAFEPGLTRLAEQFRRDTRNVVKFQFGAVPELARRLAGGDSADILIAPPGAVNEQVKNGRVDGESRVIVGRIGVGVMVRADAPEPDIATLEGFKRSLLAADSIVYTQASTGLYLEKLFDLIGIGEQLKAKTTRYASGAQVIERVIFGKGNEIGFGAITDIRLFEQRGLRFVGPLPEQVRHRTVYTAGVTTGGKSADAAMDFIQYLGTPASKAALAATGVE